MPRKINFTEANLRRLSVPPSKRIAWVYDERVGALAFAVTANGSRSFYFYRWFNGRPVRKAIGKLDKMSVDQARVRVQALNAEYNAGIDAVAIARRETTSTTLGDLWTSYRRQHLEPRATAKTLRSEDSLYDSCLEPWKDRKLLAITEDACRELHRKLGVERGGRTANRAVQLIRRLALWARLPSPFERKAIDWFPEKTRERYLEAAELQRLAVALGESADPDLADFVTLALVTGARRDNIAGMEWAEIDLDAKLWRIPASKAKSKSAMALPLAPAAIDTLKARQQDQEQRETPTAYVFPAKDGTRHRAGQSIYEAFADVRGKAKLNDVHLHDLRRTLGSWMAAQGSSLPMIGKALGHSSQDATAIYARLNLDPVRKAVDTAAAAIVKAAQPKKRKEGPTKKQK